MDPLLESTLVGAIVSGVVASFLTYFLTKKMEWDNTKAKRKQIASSIYNEILALKGRLGSLRDINGDLGVASFHTVTPIFIAGDLFCNLHGDILLFNPDLSEKLSKLYTNVVYLEDFRKRANKEYGINPDFTRSLTQEFPLIKTTFDESISLIPPILEMVEREKE